MANTITNSKKPSDGDRFHKRNTQKLGRLAPSSLEFVLLPFRSEIEVPAPRDGNHLIMEHSNFPIAS